ncbi:hypothetical protein BJ878DRAFT_543251 [Calycina marina]|uniref:Uncharacterized protein n=1 Tax=Calycina marina TaxID=1763456 RepID=A0A9P8CE61_9HELO|nr:hypothetical protein BJ878DRAFT_543251 [Calycina marina]
MPTNQRPSLSNFLAAFRAHSAVTTHSKSVSSPSTPTPNTQSSSTSTSQTAASTPRTIATSTKSSLGATSAALASIHSPRNISSPLSRSPGEEGSFGKGVGVGIGARRRGSDSSSEGFRDVLGAEKWYIGGRTATGEERYFKLGVVRRQRSGGSLSLDRLSLQ